MRENYINAYTVTLSAMVNSTALSLLVSAAASVDGGFRLLINNETMLVTTGGTTTTWTVTRGIEGSIAAGHSSGADITVVLTAGSLNQIRNDISQIGPFASLPVSGMVIGDRYQCTDNPFYLLYNGTIWQSFNGPLIQDINFASAVGSMAPDQAGNNHAWLSPSGCTIVTGGVTTDGSSGYIDTGNVCMGRYFFTVAVKFKTTSNSSSTYYEEPSLYNLSLNGQGNDFGLTVHNGFAAYWSGLNSAGDFSASSSIPVNDNSFHTVVGVCNGESIQLYVDGINAGITYTGGAINTPFGNRIGSNAGLTPYMGQANCRDFSGPAGYLAGTFARLQVYNIPLTSIQIAALIL